MLEYCKCKSSDLYKLASFGIEIGNTVTKKGDRNAGTSNSAWIWAIQ